MTGCMGKPSNLVRALLIVCQLTFTCACTPVVIWSSHESFDYDTMYRTVPNDALQKLTPEEFEKNLSQLNITGSAVIAEELCIEDLRNSKVLLNATNGSKIIYFPCVVASDEVFQKIYKQIRTLEDINDDHEFNMVFKDIDSNGYIALTGKQCRYSYTERIKREADADNSTEFKIKTNDILFYSAKSLEFEISEKLRANLTLPKVTAASSTDKDETTKIFTIKFDNVETIGRLTLEFFFEVTGIGYYTLKKVNYETSNAIDNLYTKRDILFPFNFSYHCSPRTIFANGTTFLSITEMQIQVGYKEGNPVFNDAYDCVGFTSIPIWTGIFVTVILGLIMIWALTMIMDIRTMDRFDDPKGKTITISSAE